MKIDWSRVNGKRRVNEWVHHQDRDRVGAWMCDNNVTDGDGDEDRKFKYRRVLNRITS